MLHPRARWNYNNADEPSAERLAAELGIDLLLARLLVVRGVREAEQAAAFLYMKGVDFHDPYLLDGMDAAVARIRSALERREKIRIYGDYDADGVSSTALMTRLMRMLGADFDSYIPHRVREGYGMNAGALDHAKSNGVGLIVTVDTGISAVQEIAYARELGIDVVVTDHHEPPETLPDAHAIINPKKPGCCYPFKHLAGVGVAFKLAHALLGRVPTELLELATIGTIADLMPLHGENRLLVTKGLERMKGSALPGIRALLGVSGVERQDVTATQVGFALAPRINASGRLESATDAVDLLTTDSEQEAELLAFSLDSLNKERQRIVEETAKEALEMAERRSTPRVIVVASENWNIGVIGIVASKLLDKFYCPAIVLGINSETGLAKGSARSIAGFDIYRALTACSDLLEHYGGHQAAAGMTIRVDNIPLLEARLQQLAEEWLSEADFVPILQADLACSLDDVPLSAIAQINRLAPFGMGNPAPKFVFKGLQLDDLRTMGKEKQHVKLTVRQAASRDAMAVEAVGFGRGYLQEKISRTARIDLFGELSVNEWNGVRKPQIIVQDAQVQEVQLFDWRGQKEVGRKWQESFGQPAGMSLDSEGCKRPRPAVLLFAKEDQAGLNAAFSSYGGEFALWLCEGNGGCKPLNQAAEAAPFTACTDVLLASLPPTAGLLQATLRRVTSLQRVFAWFPARQRDAGPSVMPTRDMFKLTYEAIRRQPIDFADEALTAGFCKRTGIHTGDLRFIADVFAELNFVEWNATVCRSVKSPEKRELSASRLYREREARCETERLLVYASAQELKELLLTPHGPRDQASEPLKNANVG